MRNGTRAGLLFSYAVIAFSMCSAAQAATVNISGGSVASPAYGTSAGQQNVVNSGLSGVTDSLSGLTYIGNASSAVTTSLALYNVDWYLAGAESGFTNTLVAPGVSFSESNQTITVFPAVQVPLPDPS
jgi:hypothetical protein